MRTGRTRLDPCQRLLNAAVLALGATRMDRIRAMVVPVLANAWAGAVNQPSPAAGFALVVALELVGRLLRLPATRAFLAAWSRRVILAIATLTFQLAADRQQQIARRPGMPAAKEAGRPAFVFQTLCNVKQQLGRPGITLRTHLPQFNPQHPPRTPS